jgi:uncharacterized protein
VALASGVERVYSALERVLTMIARELDRHVPQDRDWHSVLLRRMTMEMSELYLYGSYGEQIIYRLNHFIDLRLEAISILPFNICLFLLGAWLVRNEFFAPTDTGKLKRKKLMMWGLGIGLPLNAIVFTLLADYNLIADRYLIAPIVSLGYIGLISYLLDKFNDSFLMRSMERIGKVALSCYILQNVIASLIFYGWGFGAASYSNTWITVAAWILISALLAVFAHIWLMFFKQGPFEYVWRRATHLKKAKSHKYDINTKGSIQ